MTSVRYRVPVADELLEQADWWQDAEGFRLISADGPWPGHPYVTICTFEDDNAPAELEGRLVEPVLQQVMSDDGSMRCVRVLSRQVVSE